MTEAHHSSHGIQSPVMRSLVTGGLVIGIGLVLGYSLSFQWWMPIALVGAMWAALLMAWSIPAYLVIILFFHYGTFNIVDLMWFGHVFGLFRLNDLLVVTVAAMVGGTIAMQRWRPLRLNRTYFGLPMFLFFVWIGVEVIYTVLFIGEQPILALRVARRYVPYLFVIPILQWFQSERHWRALLRFLHVCVILVLLIGLLNVIGVRTTLGHSFGTLTRLHRGLFKLFNPGESLMFAFLMFSFWRYCHSPSRRNMFWLIMGAGGGCLFLFRARIAGALLGLGGSLLLTRGQVRTRAITLLALVTGLILAGLLAVTAITRAYHPDAAAGAQVSLFDYFRDAFVGITGQEETAPILWRQLRIEQRLPLIKEHPIMGVGFTSIWGDVVADLWRTGSLAQRFVDAGWVECLLQLGSIGTALLLLFLGLTAAEARRILHTCARTTEDRALCLALFGYVVMMLSTLYSFSYPSLQGPITSFAILTAFVVHIRDKAVRHPHHGRHPSQAPPGKKTEASRTGGMGS
ncbi:MAG: hypothetical protein ISS31_07835 [Kiritimatiellae bacterium]|nr:hypothetical protein [Kiritimatiellia bacterium]